VEMPQQESATLMGFGDERFNVNLSILFTELPLLERPAAAAAAGFTAVELWWPWVDSPTPEQAELDALNRAIEDAGVRLNGLNLYAGQLPGPDRGALSTGPDGILIPEHGVRMIPYPALVRVLPRSPVFSRVLRRSQAFSGVSRRFHGANVTRNSPRAYADMRTPTTEPSNQALNNGQGASTHPGCGHILATRGPSARGRPAP
jgi:hypothetical protein